MVFGRRKGWKTNGKSFKPLLSPLLAGSIRNIHSAFAGHQIDPGHRLRLYRTYLASAFLAPFRVYEQVRYRQALRKITLTQPPVFILGHWRSGTTYLHNLLSQDPQFAYVSTFQSVFPEHLGSQWLFKPVMNILMPSKRAGDNVELNVNYPQEEEFGLGNMCPYCYYYFWLFPRETEKLYDKYLTFSTSSKEVKESWQASYLRLAKKAVYDLKKERFISKNPPNTGRIKLLLEMFPDAKFVYIYRNPITTYLSTKKFFLATMGALKFQEVSTPEVEKTIFTIYKKLFDDYQRDKALIPKGNLIEIQYEPFQKNPLPTIKKIYDRLKIPHYDTAESHFSSYIAGQQHFKKGKYQISQQELDRITKKLNFAIKLWKYDDSAAVVEVTK